MNHDHSMANTHSSTFADTHMEDMSSNMSNMSMTFTPFMQYKGLKILFEWWTIQTLLQFILSCIILLLFSILNSWIRSKAVVLDRTRTNRSNTPLLNQRSRASPLPPSFSNTDLSTMDDYPSSKYIRMHIALIVSANYGLSLLLMLAAMTYQPCIVISIVIGT